jgi:hypothetical protein
MLPSQPNQKRKLSWDTAIQDAEREIQKANRRIATLKESIKIFTKRKIAGDPFPGSSDEVQQQ